MIIWSKGMNVHYFKVIILKDIHRIEFLESEAKYVLCIYVFSTYPI